MFLPLFIFHTIKCYYITICVKRERIERLPCICIEKSGDLSTAVKRVFSTISMNIFSTDVFTCEENGGLFQVKHFLFIPFLFSYTVFHSLLVFTVSGISIYWQVQVFKLERSLRIYSSSMVLPFPVLYNQTHTYFQEMQSQLCFLIFSYKVIQFPF